MTLTIRNSYANTSYANPYANNTAFRSKLLLDDGYNPRITSKLLEKIFKNDKIVLQITEFQKAITNKNRKITVYMNPDLEGGSLSVSTLKPLVLSYGEYGTMENISIYPINTLGQRLMDNYKAAAKIIRKNFKVIDRNSVKKPIKKNLCKDYDMEIYASW